MRISEAPPPPLPLLIPVPPPLNPAAVEVVPTPPV